MTNARSTAHAEQSVIVTGASSGIGRAIAIELATRGAGHVLVHFNRNEEGANQTADAVRSAGSRASILQADLADDQAIDLFVADAFETMGDVGAWINNAGLDVLTGPNAELSFQEKLKRLMAVDLVGTVRMSRDVVNRLGRQETRIPPSMTFIGWDQAPHGMEGDAGQMFGPVKAAVMAFANSLAQEVAPGIRVNTVAPGWIQTSWGESTSDYWDGRAKSQSLMQRWGTPEDVARAVAYVSDPSSTFLTGQTIAVNGGWSRRH